MVKRRKRTVARRVVRRPVKPAATLFEEYATGFTQRTSGFMPLYQAAGARVSKVKRQAVAASVFVKKRSRKRRKISRRRIFGPHKGEREIINIPPYAETEEERARRVAKAATVIAKRSAKSGVAFARRSAKPAARVAAKTAFVGAVGGVRGLANVAGRIAAKPTTKTRVKGVKLRLVSGGRQTRGGIGGFF